MSVQNVDVVLVIDASDSMKPCIDQLRRHLRELIKPMQANVGKVRFGLVALNVLSQSQGSQNVYNYSSLAGGAQLSLRALYEKGNEQVELLTENTEKIIACLDAIKVAGNEDNLWALDTALDYPFGPLSTTKRVVALFSDEPFEGGAMVSLHSFRIAALIEKIHRRHVKLFCALPYSDLAQELSQANGSELEAVEGGQGLSSVNFKELLGQMGKSISVSSMQGGIEEDYHRALFGQDRMTRTDDVNWKSADRT